MSKKCITEVCCGSVMDAVAAYRGGADRIELNSDLFHGGLTPSLGALKTVKRHCPELQVMCMVRPREGGFCYTDMEFESMLDDAKEFIDCGADGIVFGFLNEDGTIDANRCKKMMDVIGGKESVFHRAIDVTPDWKKALDILIGLGITRILTSGQKPTVPEGAIIIKEMIEYSSGRIEILPGGGITGENAEWVRNITGTSMMHIAMHRIAFDRSTQANPAIYYGGCVYPPEDRYSVTATEDIRKFVNAL